MALTPTEALEHIAEIYDSYTDDADGEWSDSSSIAEEVSGILGEAGYLISCSSHGWYATFRGECPTCNYCGDCECSPCECDDDDDDDDELEEEDL